MKARNSKNSSQSLPVKLASFKGGLNPTKEQQSMATILYANNSVENSDSSIEEVTSTHQGRQDTAFRGRLNLMAVINDDAQDYFFLAILVSGTLLIALMISFYVVIVLLSLFESSNLFW